VAVDTTSPDGTQIIGGLINAVGEVYTITPTLQVGINGITDNTTRDVVKLVCHEGVVWQLNKFGNWWSRVSRSTRWVAQPSGPPSAVGGITLDQVYTLMMVIDTKVDEVLLEIKTTPIQIEKLDALHKQLQANHDTLQAAVAAANKNLPS
jgi:hypothetical protein